MAQQTQQLSTCTIDTSTTVSLKVTLKKDETKHFMVKEFPVNKLLPLSVQELCEVITAMRTLSCDLLEKPVDSFIDNSYVYVITEYAHDFPYLLFCSSTESSVHTYRKELFGKLLVCFYLLSSTHVITIISMEPSVLRTYYWFRAERLRTWVPGLRKSTKWLLCNSIWL